MNAVKRHQKQFHKGKAVAERREILACLLLVCRHLYTYIPPQRWFFVMKLHLLQILLFL